jgi:ribokinase
MTVGPKAAAHIVVVGSVNMDISVRVAVLPLPGETVSGGNVELSLGGKGANQAVAAARLGAKVSLIGKIGHDAFGEAARLSLSLESIDLAGLSTLPEVSTGVALINVADNGQNIITVSPGANAALSESEVNAASHQWSDQTVLLLQNEIPTVTSLHAAKMMKKAGGIVVCDPAPAKGLDLGIFPFVDVVTPNATEAAALTGIALVDRASAYAAARALVQKGAGAAIVKLGVDGCVFAGAFGEGYIPAQNVKAIDTVAAGDCFNGALAVALSEGLHFQEAIVFASKAASLSVTRRGASRSMPYRAEIT